MNIGFSAEVTHSNINISTPKGSEILTHHNMNSNVDLKEECAEVAYSSVPSTPENSSEIFSMETLLQRVDEFRKTEQLETLRKLTRENCLLQKHIACYQESWCAILDVLQEAYEAVLLIQDALQKCSYEETAAERDWLTFWGIHYGSEETSGYRPAEWI
ncbi:MAG: hypothetical protein M1840_005516 [Geoglossum simile]|nr:MAG: hypothetical protein M1840_005516 [Geoglossum simile]